LRFFVNTGIRTKEKSMTALEPDTKKPEADVAIPRWAYCLPGRIIMIISIALMVALMIMVGRLESEALPLELQVIILPVGIGLFLLLLSIGYCMDQLGVLLHRTAWIDQKMGRREKV
jgi:hypothetical protein